MHKKPEEDPVKEAIISSSMLKSCKDEIAKFGFSGPEYIKFLISVKAMRDETTVMMYNNSDIEKYRADFIKKHESSIGDNFVLDKFKAKSGGDTGKSFDSGWFAPRSFWDYILKTKNN